LRKIVISTNIAETSVTIDGIVYVVDPGYVKLSQYDASRRMSRLVVTTISQASAQQRAGRAGRTRPGICFRLYTQASYEMTLSSHTVPEIERTELSEVILSMLAAGIRNIVEFPWMDPPPRRGLLGGVESLYHLGAITIGGEMTEIGRKMSLLPVSPALAKALVSSERYRCTEDMCGLVAILSAAGDVWIRPRKEAAKADEAHGRFRADTGDHMMLMNLLDEFVCEPKKARKDWCRKNYVEYGLLDAADRNRQALRRLIESMGIKIVKLECPRMEREEVMLRALLGGLFTQIAMLNPNTNKFTFLQSQREAELYWSSSVRERRNAWVVYSDYVSTKQDALRTASLIQPEWVFAAAPSYFEPSLFPDSIVKTALFQVKGRVERARSRPRQMDQLEA
jgi:pre-mRNA-splicing factor ATP-dependent RNA helicase DHX15/PRP43